MSMSGWINGYITTRTLKYFGATDWIFSAVISAMVLPLWIYTTIGAADTIELFLGASMPTTVLGGIIYSIMWMFSNGITCFIGAYMGYLAPQGKKTIKISAVKRKIPDQPCYMSIFWTTAMFGLIQFAAIFTEFQYLIESVWRNQIYAMFGFLAANYLMHFFVVGTLSIIQTYLTLAS